MLSCVLHMASLKIVPFFAVVFVLLPGVASSQSVQHPNDFFGFEIGTDGKLARYPRVLDYLRHLGDRSDRVRYAVRGTTTNGHPYVLATFSSPANLDRLDRLIAINHQLADPRGLTKSSADALAADGGHRVRPAPTASRLLRT